MPDWGAAFLAVLTVVLMTHRVEPAFADPYPPSWNSGTGAAVHFSPAPWPNEPANPADCGSTCGDWKPYTRFQSNITDPRIQDPSNGGTAPQNYVNISSSCTDKTLPSIYYNLHQDADPTKDVIFFRWRVEQIANNYATGPSAGSYGASDPWSSALWTVLFDVNGDGYVELSTHKELAAELEAMERPIGFTVDSDAGKETA